MDGARDGDAFCMDKVAWAHDARLLEGGSEMAAFWRRRTFATGVRGWTDVVRARKLPLKARWMYVQGDEGMFRWFADRWYALDEKSDPDVVFLDVGKDKAVKAMGDGGYEFDIPVIEAGRYDRVFATFESCDADLGKCEWSFSHGLERDIQDPRHMRMPCASSAAYPRTADFLRLFDFDRAKEMKRKTKFCNFIYGHDTDMRRQVFEALSAYKRVDAFGPTGLNNMGGRLVPKGKDVIAMKPKSFLRRYKFTVAFENFSKPGYVTEKLVEPLIARSVPIYWGDPRIADEFNTKAFVNCHDYFNLDEVVARVRELDENDEEYVAMLAEPILKPGVFPSWADKYALCRRLVEIFG
jgi:hypothetical protein